MKRYDVLFLALLLFFVTTVRNSNWFFSIFVIFVLLSFSFLKLWKRYVNKHIHAKIILHVHRAFPGERVDGELIIENHSKLPIFGLHVYFDFSNRIDLQSEFLRKIKNDVTDHFNSYKGVFNIDSRERRSVPITLVCRERGQYAFKSIQLYCKDPFGLYEMEKEIHVYEEILVYPKEIELQHLSLTHRMPQGETVVQRWIHDDIFFPVGSRPYQYGDAFNRIDFKASAKLQSLYTKQYDFTAHGDICVVANLQTTPFSWEPDREVFERIISIVARISRESLQKDLRLSFIANAQMGRGMRSFEIPSSTGRKHYRKILEVLARFSSFHATSFTLALSQVRHRYSNGAPIVIITAIMDEVLAKEIQFLQQRGFEIFLIDPTETIPRIVKWHYAQEKEQVLQHA